MRTRCSQAGAAGALVLALMVIILVSLLATSVLSRLSQTSVDATQTMANLAKAMQALEGYAAAAQRLPCPADPALDTGLETPGANGTCLNDDGTLPWLTIGMKREDALDSWGRKLSYRVYTGNKGSLTQAGGVSMVNCDTVEASPAGTTSGAGSLGGLCQATQDTTPAQFLNGKGLTLTDMGTTYNDVAYVIMSHGPTGLGGYTVSGAQLDLPKGNELKNTKATGAFTIQANSDPDTAADKPQHYDDILVYRRLQDLITRIGLDARDWPG